MTVWDVPTENVATGLLGPIVTELGLTSVVPPGPDSQRFASRAEMLALLRGWDEVSVEPLRWELTVEPGAWFDALADATPRTGAVLAQAGPERRAEARERYVEVALKTYGAGDGTVRLPAAALLASARKR